MPLDGGVACGEHVQVLEVAAGQVVVGSDLDLALAGLADDNVVAKVVGAAVNLDAVLEELLEGGDVEDLVAGRLRSVDDELLRLLLLLLLLYHEERLSLLYFSPDSPSPPAAAARTTARGNRGAYSKARVKYIQWEPLCLVVGGVVWEGGFVS
jgi:hypothetical protein